MCMRLLFLRHHRSRVGHVRRDCVRPSLLRVVTAQDVCYNFHWRCGSSELPPGVVGGASNGFVGLFYHLGACDDTLATPWYTEDFRCGGRCYFEAKAACNAASGQAPAATVLVAFLAIFAPFLKGIKTALLLIIISIINYGRWEVVWVLWVNCASVRTIAQCFCDWFLYGSQR